MDVANATYTNTIGTPLMTAYWKDPEFDPKQHAFYYVRVIEIPTPRWTAYDQKRFGIKMADYVPMTVNRPRLHLAHLVHAVKRLVREPLVHFVVLGALIFGAYAWLNRGASAQRRLKRSPSASPAKEVAWLADTWVRQQQRPPTQEELRGLVTRVSERGTARPRSPRDGPRSKTTSSCAAAWRRNSNSSCKTHQHLAEPTDEDLRQVLRSKPGPFSDPAESVVYSDLF